VLRETYPGGELMPAVIAVARRLSVCYLPWRMTAGWRADEYAMALLYLHATGRPGLATPWSALQADLPHFPVQVLLQPEE
jgi:hypothetical protein